MLNFKLKKPKEHMSRWDPFRNLKSLEDIEQILTKHDHKP